LTDEHAAGLRRLHRRKFRPLMSHSSLKVRKAAVLGAGVMGAQIAAHFVNANVPVVLFELTAKDSDPNANVRRAIENLNKIEPAPLGSTARAAYIEAAN